MTDERYVYTQEIRERKGMANGARGVKKGSRSQKCTLPSDSLSAAQRKKLNGPLTEVQLSHPMSWEDWKRLSPSLRFLYLDHIVSNYHARRVDILAMFGISTGTFFNYEKAMPGHLTWPRKRHSPAPEWDAFLAGAHQLEDEPSTASEESAVVEAAPEPTRRAQSSLLMSGSVTVRGTLGDAAAALLRLMDDTSARYRFTISFEKEVPND